MASVEVAGGEVRVTGLARGNATVTLSWAEDSLALPVQVRPWAARLPGRVDVPISGSMPYEEAFRRVLLGRSAPHPEAKVAVGFEKPPALGVDTPVRVSATGVGLLAAEGRVLARFVAAPVDVPRAGALIMSNRPEKVQAEGTLLQVPLPSAPVRLLVHHRNEPGSPERFLEVLVRNPHASPVRLFAVLAGVGPSQDEIFAGHLATRRFLDRLLACQGVTLRVAPGETLLVERLRMRPGQTVSEMGWLQPLEGNGVELTVRAVDSDGGAPLQDLADPGPGPFPTGRGLFPAEIHASYAHDAGSRYTFIPLGDAPFTADPRTGEPNPGNFGVVHRLRILLGNPTGEPREVRLDFRPRGGPARGVFYVDGALVETPMASQGSPFRLGRWTLQPGEERDVFLETLPQSGSNYPVTLEVQSDFLNLPSAVPPPVEPLEPRWLP